MPHGAEAEVGRTDQHAYVHVGVAFEHERSEQGAGHQAYRPVEIAHHEREQAGEDQRLGRPCRIRQRRQPVEQAIDRTRGDTGVRGDHRDGELHRQAEQVPHPRAPGQHGFLQCRTGADDTQHDGDRGQHEADHPGVRHPPFGDGGQPGAEASELVEHEGNRRLGATLRRYSCVPGRGDQPCPGGLVCVARKSSAAARMRSRRVVFMRSRLPVMTRRRGWRSKKFRWCATKRQ